MTTPSLIVLAVTLGALVGAGGVLIVGAALTSCRRRAAQHQPQLGSVVTELLHPLNTFAVVLDETLSVVYANPAAREDPRISGEQLREPGFMRRAHRVLETGVPDTYEPHPNHPEESVWIRIARLQRRFLVVFATDLGEEQRLNAMRRDFIANMSHELKTPISAIGLLAEAVLEAADEPEIVRTFAKKLHKQAHRLGELSRDVIQLSEAQGSLDPDRLEFVSLTALAEAELAAHHDYAGQQGVTLKLLITPAGDAGGAQPAPQGAEPTGTDWQGAWCLGNRAQLGTALANLLSNAIRHSRHGACVTVSVSTGERFHTVTIIDSGEGIAGEHLPRLFERFYRVDPARSRESGGTGLGLAIVKHTALAHGGDIEVQSEAGVGSHFTISLPAADRSAAVRPNAPKKRKKKSKKKSAHAQLPTAEHASGEQHVA